MLKHEIIFCPKFARPVLTGELVPALTDLLHKRASQLAVEVETISIQPDHVRIIVIGDVPLKHLVNQLKNHSARCLRAEFPALRSRLPCMWTRAFYARTLGELDPIGALEFLKAQKGR